MANLTGSSLTAGRIAANIEFPLTRGSSSLGTTTALASRWGFSFRYRARMADRLLKWQRTDLAVRPSEDYTGLDTDHPRLYAHVYFSVSHQGETPWFWTLADGDHRIATGYAASVAAAVGAAEIAYAAWRGSKSDN